MKYPMNLSLVEHETVVWHHTIPAGEPFENVTNPSYWQHVVSRMRPGHEIKISAEDRTFCALLFVRDVGKHEARVAVVWRVDFDEDDEFTGGVDDSDDTYIKWRGPALRFGVFRTSDEECIKDKFETKDAAMIWVSARAKEMAA
ncbi:hypothetical protein [Profundibacter sp.]